MREEFHPRLRAVCDLIAPSVREFSGRHEYDGRIPCYSAAGVADMLARLGQGAPLDDAHDEAHLTAFENYLRVQFGELEMHRRNPAIHLAALDLACYDREYAAPEVRHAARQQQLAQWPDALATAVTALGALLRLGSPPLGLASRALAEG
jgi:hypothetical protein